LARGVSFTLNQVWPDEGQAAHEPPLRGEGQAACGGQQSGERRAAHEPQAPDGERAACEQQLADEQAACGQQPPDEEQVAHGQQWPDERPSALLECYASPVGEGRSSPLCSPGAELPSLRLTGRLRDLQES
jgi:hypothetical protein